NPCAPPVLPILGLAALRAPSMFSRVLGKPCCDARHHVFNDLLQLCWLATVPRLDRNPLHDGSQMARQTPNLVCAGKGLERFRDPLAHSITPRGRVAGERRMLRVTCNH